MRNVPGNLVAQDNREKTTLFFATEGRICHTREGRLSLVWEGLAGVRLGCRFFFAEFLDSPYSSQADRRSFQLSFQLPLKPRLQTAIGKCSQCVVYRGDIFSRRIDQDFFTPVAADRRVPRPQIALTRSMTAINRSLSRWVPNSDAC